MNAITEMLLGMTTSKCVGCSSRKTRESGITSCEAYIHPFRRHIPLGGRCPHHSVPRFVEKRVVKTNPIKASKKG